MSEKTEQRYTVDLKGVAFLVSLAIGCGVLLSMLGSSIDTYVGRKQASIEARVGSLERRLVESNELLRKYIDTKLNEANRLRVRQWDRYEDMNRQQTLLKEQVQALRSEIKANSLFKDRWYNTFRSLERHTKHEARLKELEDRFDRDVRLWRATVRREPS